MSISHTAVHVIFDFFLYSGVDLHDKGDNLENRVFCDLNFLNMI